MSSVLFIIKLSVGLNTMISIIVGSLSNILPIIAIAVGYTSYQWHTRELRIILWYCLVSLFAGLLATILAYRGINNHFVIHLFAPVQFSMFVYILSRWQPQALIQKLFIGTIFLFIIFWSWGFFMVEDLRSFSTTTRPVTAVLLVLASAVTLVQTVRASHLPLSRTPAFWISSGILIYFAGMSVLFSMSNMLLTVSIETLRLLWAPIQSSLHLTINIFFAIGFLCLRPKLT